MQNILEFLRGKKTYLLSAAGIITVLAAHFHWVDSGTAATLLALEGFGSIAALRAGLDNTINKYFPEDAAQPQPPVPPAPVAGQ